MKIKNCILSVALILGSCSDAVLVAQPPAEAEQIKEAESKFSRFKKAVRCIWRKDGCDPKKRKKIIASGLAVAAAVAGIGMLSWVAWRRSVQRAEREASERAAQRKRRSAQQAEREASERAASARPAAAEAPAAGRSGVLPGPSTQGGEAPAAVAAAGPSAWRPSALAPDPTLVQSSVSRTSAVAARPGEGITPQQMETFKIYLKGGWRSISPELLESDFSAGYEILRKNYKPDKSRAARIRRLLDMVHYVFSMYRAKEMGEAAQIRAVQALLPRDRDWKKEERLLDALDVAAVYIETAQELPRVEKWKAGERKQKHRVTFKLQGEQAAAARRQEEEEEGS